LVCAWYRENREWYRIVVGKLFRG